MSPTPRDIDQLNSERRELKKEILKVKQAIVEQEEAYNQDVERFEEQQKVHKERRAKLQEEEKVLSDAKSKAQIQRNKHQQAVKHIEERRGEIQYQINLAKGFKNQRENALRRRDYELYPI